MKACRAVLAAHQAPDLWLPTHQVHLALLLSLSLSLYIYILYIYTYIHTFVFFSFALSRSLALALFPFAVPFSPLLLSPGICKSSDLVTYGSFSHLICSLAPLHWDPMAPFPSHASFLGLVRSLVACLLAHPFCICSSDLVSSGLGVVQFCCFLPRSCSRDSKTADPCRGSLI